MDPRDLAATWRSEAELYRRRGQEALALATESFAGDLEAWWAEWRLEALPLEQAASESGYSYSRLQAMISEGKSVFRNSSKNR